jgi:hypothetical protein
MGGLLSLVPSEDLFLVKREGVVDEGVTIYSRGGMVHSMCRKEIRWDGNAVMFENISLSRLDLSSTHILFFITLASSFLFASKGKLVG